MQSARPHRPPLEVVFEKAIEALIRLCGISSIVFVFAIFIFVFRDLLEEVLERVSSNQKPKMPGRRDYTSPDRVETAYY